MWSLMGFLASASQALFPIPLNYNSLLCGSLMGFGFVSPIAAIAFRPTATSTSTRSTATLLFLFYFYPRFLFALVRNCGTILPAEYAALQDYVERMTWW